jgi:predicted transcriptional regulator
MTMVRKNTQDKKFSVTAKTELLRREMTVSELADKIGRIRSTVSGAIHSKRFPLVRKQVAKALRIAL